jgi:rSAM/selenodomain-associated transferase 2
MGSHRLSIVIPALNEADNIQALLRDLAYARERGAELIVVDGGSTDATIALATGHTDQILTSARGRALQLNSGAAAAGGDTLLFLHADCRVPTDLDLVLSAALGGKTEAWGRFDVRIESRRRILALVATLMNWRSRWSGIATGDQGIFVTRELFTRIGGFPVQPLMEDIAISRRLKRITAPHCLRCRITTSGRRWERRGVARTILLMWRMRLAYFFGADPGELAPRYEHVR